MHNMKTNILLTSITCVALVGCSGNSNQPGSGNPNPIDEQKTALASEIDFNEVTGEINKLGIFRVHVQQLSDLSVIATYPLARFSQLDAPLPKRAMDLIATDAGAKKSLGCTLHSGWLDWDVYNPNDIYPERTQAKKELKTLLGEYPASNISGGTELTLSSSDGTIIPMDIKMGRVGLYGPNLPDNWNGWPRSGSVIDIPGETFPAVTSVEISTVEPIMDLQSDGVNGYVPAGSKVTWSVPQNPDPSLITFVAMGDGYLVCHTPDTGTFTWPDEINEMSYVEGIVVERTAFSYLQIDDALLIFNAYVDTFMPLL